MKKDKYTQKISIVFPTFNGWDDTQICLSSIQKVSYPKHLIEVTVVDNNSSDGTPDKIKKLFPEVTVIKLACNTGYAKAVNIAVKKSKSDYIMYGNNDVIYEKNFFNAMVDLAESDLSIGVIGGKAYRIDLPKEIAFGGLRLNPYLGYLPFDLSNLDQVRSCDLVPAGGFFVRKSILTTVGQLDENYFLYFEDVDFSLRAKQKGFKVMYNPHAIFYHGNGKTALRGNLQEMIYYGYRSKWRCLIKNATVLQITTSLLTHIFFFIHLQNIRSSIKTYKPFIKALYWNIKHINQTLNARKTQNKNNLSFPWTGESSS